MPLARGGGGSRKLQWYPGRGFLTVQPQAPQGPEVIGQAGVVLTAKHEHSAVHSTHAVSISGLWPHPIYLQLCPHRPSHSKITHGIFNCAEPGGLSDFKIQSSSLAVRRPRELLLTAGRILTACFSVATHGCSSISTLRHVHDSR